MIHIAPKMNKSYIFMGMIINKCNTFKFEDIYSIYVVLDGRDTRLRYSARAQSGYMFLYAA